MRRTIGKLSALTVNRITKSGMHSDGGGLYLQVGESGSKSWIFRFMLDGRAREMGLGPLHTISLAEARAAALECRKLRLKRVDPIEERRAGRRKATLEAAHSMTFKECGNAYIEAHRASWRSAKHASQWEGTIATYAYPVFGDEAVQLIDVALVMKALLPIWTAKTVTATRVRGRIESVLDWATARGYRAGENPARWRGHLENLLPKPSKIQRVEHHSALPYGELGAFMTELRAQAGIPARALEFLILTAARSGEVLGARPEEFDTKEKMWVVPADRIKAGKEHRVPLCARAVAIVQEMQKICGEGKYMFPGAKAGRPLGGLALLDALKRQARADLTVHGFRSTFRDWCAERTNYPREVAEMALAHSIGDAVEAAYRRGDLFTKRRRMMEEWGRYCGMDGKAGAVVDIRVAR